MKRIFAKVANIYMKRGYLAFANVTVSEGCKNEGTTKRKS